MMTSTAVLTTMLLATAVALVDSASASHLCGARITRTIAHICREPLECDSDLQVFRDVDSVTSVVQQCCVRKCSMTYIKELCCLLRAAEESTATSGESTEPEPPSVRKVLANPREFYEVRDRR